MYKGGTIKVIVMSIKSKDVLEEPNDDVVLEKILSRFRPLGPYYRRFMPFLIIATMSNAFYCMNYVFAAVSVDYRYIIFYALASVLLFLFN